MARHLIRFVVSMFVIFLVDRFVPWVAIPGLKAIALTAISISVIGWLVELILGSGITPYARGMIGIFVTAAVLVSAHLFIDGYKMTVLGVIWGSLLIGVIDIFIPVGARYSAR